ncbi:MAG TPA: hypothetical protein VH352_02795, partial [Pseudonocardiaceae bacterium]|nr:hypothetical protein [Pseudonocardiaceae bacterium]
MNLFQRLIAFWMRLWGVASGLDVREIVPLPAPVAPQTSAAALIAEADAHGIADARAAMLNQWSFGGPGDPESDLFDPDYVRGLRHRRAAAIASLRVAQRLTDDRVAPVRVRRDESRDLMANARARMSGLATRDDLVQARALAEIDPEPVPDPEPEPDGEQTPWEGESTPLPLGWRLLILVGLVAAELPVQFSVFDYSLGPDMGTLVVWLSLTTSAIVVFGPFVAGTLMRTRPATGADHRIGYAVIVLVAAWLFTVVVLGLIRGRLFQGRVGAGTAHVGLVTVVLMFVALLLVVGAMSFMLGLARRHPFQEAYVRNRTRRDHFEMVIRTAGA